MPLPVAQPVSHWQCAHCATASRTGAPLGNVAAPIWDWRKSCAAHVVQTFSRAAFASEGGVHSAGTEYKDLPTDLIWTKEDGGYHTGPHGAMDPYIIAACIFIRVASCILVRTSFYPDEFWQSMEVAHRMVYG